MSQGFCFILKKKKKNARAVGSVEKGRCTIGRWAHLTHATQRLGQRYYINLFSAKSTLQQ